MGASVSPNATAVATLGILAAAMLGMYAIENQPKPQSPEPETISVNLDLTKPALSACLNAFLRYGQGGPISDYRCEVEGASVALYGPNWAKYSQGPNGTPETIRLGAVRMEEQ